MLNRVAAITQEYICSVPNGYCVMEPGLFLSIRV